MPYSPAMAGSGVLAAGVSAAITLLQKNRETFWAMAIWAPLLVAPYAFFTYRLSPEHPWKKYVGAVMIAGLATIALVVRGGFHELVQPVLFFNALVWLASAAATLAIYIRNTERPVPGGE